MGTLMIPLQSIRSEEGPHYCLGAKREEAVRRQATINPIHKFGYTFGESIPGLYCVAWLGQGQARKCQFKESEEERYESCSVQQTFTAETFSKKAGKGKIQQ